MAEKPLEKARLEFMQALSDELDIDLDPEVVKLGDRIIARLWMKGLVIAPKDSVSIL